MTFKWPLPKKSMNRSWYHPLICEFSVLQTIYFFILFVGIDVVSSVVCFSCRSVAKTMRSINIWLLSRFAYCMRADLTDINKRRRRNNWTTLPLIIVNRFTYNNVRIELMCIQSDLAICSLYFRTEYTSGFSRLNWNDFQLLWLAIKINRRQSCWPQLNLL